MSRFNLVEFRDLLSEKGYQAGFNITYPHGVELPGWSPATIGHKAFNTVLTETRQWCRDNLPGQFTTKRMRSDALREVGIRFEFESPTDAAYFRLRWC